MHGRLASVTLPTAAPISYTTTAAAAARYLALTVAPRGLLVRLQTHWTYTRTGYSALRHHNHDTDPQVTKPFHFSGFTQRKVGLSGTGTLLETILIAINAVFSNCPTATVTPPITQLIAIVIFPI